jgi:Rrf2 family iron-sulfur cluster assembly transcriptional regulator
MALVELAARDHERQQAGAAAGQEQACSAGPVSLAEIAAAQLLSVAYLEQLFARLRRAGLVDSARGPGGGYRLALPPEQIAIGTIIDAVDEPISATRCDEDNPGCLAGNRCLTHDLWHELGEQIRLFLLHTTLADVIHGRICGRAVPPVTPAP